jgi:MFS family permease
MILGVALVFTEQRWLFAPGFFLLTGADAGLASVRPAYISELFPTEVRATLLSFVFAVVVAAGSLGLVIVGVLDGTWTVRTSIYALSAVMLAGLAAMRGLPETVGVDVIRAEQPSVS